MSQSKRRPKGSKRPVSRSLVQQQPLADQSQQLLSNIRQLIEIKQLDTAINLLVTLLEVDPANPEGLYLQGELQMQHGEVEKALQSFSIAAYRMPNNAKLFAYLAKLHAQLGHHRASISAMHRHIELQPENIASMQTLGAIYYAVGMKQRGRYWVSEGARREPIYSPKETLHKSRRSCLAAIGGV